MVRQGYFPFDTRVRREVDSLVAAGHQVDVICMRGEGEPSLEHRERLVIHRLPLRHQRRGWLRYVGEHLLFFLMASTLLTALHLRRRLDLVQVNSIPDSLVFAALIPRLLGARVLLDLHECMPEFYASRFKTGPQHPGVRAMAFVEQASIGFADFAITCTDDMREAFVRRGAPPSKIAVVMNSADESIFDAHRYPPHERTADRFVLICHGSVEERYGIDTIIRAVQLLKDKVPGLRLEIYGEGSYLAELQDLARTLGADGHVWFSEGFVPLEDLLRAIASADAGVVAMKRDAFRDLTHCNKLFDFIAMRRPVIVSRTRSVEGYFNESCFQFFTSEDEQDLARVVYELYANPDLAGRLVQEAERVNEPYRWPRQRRLYRQVVEGMIGLDAFTVSDDGLPSPWSSGGGHPEADRGMISVQPGDGDGDSAGSLGRASPSE